MKEALQRRKSHGIDLTIVIGEPKNQDDKSRELAPEVEDTGEEKMDGDPSVDKLNALEDQMNPKSLMGPPMAGQKPQADVLGSDPNHSDEASDKALIERMLSKHELEEGDEPATSIGARSRNLMKSKFKR